MGRRAGVGQNPGVTRPLLLLDVDGVLNPFDGDCPAGYAEHDLFPGEEPVRVNTAHGDWLAELAAHFDVVWATAWNDDANRILGPLLGIPGFPVITMPPAPFQPGDKVTRVAAHAAGRAAAWIDDLHTTAGREWAAQRPWPTLLVSADPALGLTREHVDLLITWARGGARHADPVHAR